MRLTIAGVALLAGASLALADTVTMNYTGLAAHRSGLSVHQNGGISTNVHAGELKFNVTARSGTSGPPLGTLRTFCVDVYQFVSSPGVYDVSALEDAPIGGGAPSGGMGTAKADALRSMYSYAIGTGKDFSNNDFAAAFQLAIWEIVADFGSTTGLDVASGQGDFYLSSTSGFTSGISSALSDLFAAVNGSYTINPNIKVGALTGSGLQDQMYFVVVPLPGSASLAAAGLLGLGVVVRRRRAR